MLPGGEWEERGVQADGTCKLFTQQFWWGSGIGLRERWQHNLLFARSLSDCRSRRVSSLWEEGDGLAGSCVCCLALSGHFSDGLG